MSRMSQRGKPGCLTATAGAATVLPMADKARLFVALDLPERALSALDDLRRDLDAVDGVRLVSPETLHLTLVFVGEAEPEPVAEALSAVRAPSFGLRVEGAGMFRRRRGASPVWVGVPPEPGLVHLQGAVARALGDLVERPDRRPYRPHVTIARAREHTQLGQLRRLLAGHRELASPDFQVTECVLYESELQPSGAVHRPLARVPLGS